MTCCRSCAVLLTSTTRICWTRRLWPRPTGIGRGCRHLTFNDFQLRLVERACVDRLAVFQLLRLELQTHATMQVFVTTNHDALKPCDRIARHVSKLDLRHPVISSRLPNGVLRIDLRLQIESRLSTLECHPTR